MVCLANVDLALFSIFLSGFVLGKQSCNHSSTEDDQCPVTQVCTPLPNLQEGYCECLPGYSKVNSTFCQNLAELEAVPSPRSSSLTVQEESSSGGHVVAGILIPILLVTVVISGVYLGRKYHVISYIRNKLNQRSSNYDEVMIGQDLDDDDDPPLR